MIAPPPTEPPDRCVEPDLAAGPAAAAGELVAQGILEYLHRGDPALREQRVARVTRAVLLTEPEGRARRHPYRFPTAARWALAAAAVLALAASLILVGVPGESSALAEIHQSVAALRTGVDRRYEARLQPADAPRPTLDPGAVIDMRAPGLLIIAHHPPGSSAPIFVGRDADGPWALRADGAVQRDNPWPFWPPWSVDGQTRLVDSIDRLLDQIPATHDLKKLPPAQIGTTGALFDRISATRRARGGPMPDRVELWIDPGTSIVERIEFRWENTDQAPRPPHGDDDADDPPSPPPPDHFDNGHGTPPFPSPPDGRHDHGHGPPPHPPGQAAAHPGRLALIVFQRVETPPLAPDWFTPEAHRAVNGD